MKYKGMELKPIEKVQVFEEGKVMLVWLKTWKEPLEKVVYGIVKRPNLKNVICCPVEYDFCAEIPKPKTRRMNSLEVMEYLWERNKTDCVTIKDGDSALWSPLGFYIISYPKDYKFGILKNGKITEFEIPEVEVNDE